MAVSFTRLSWWYWSGKEKEPVISTGSSSTSDWDLGLMREQQKQNFPSVKKGAKIATSSKKVRKKWQSREERRRRVDKEYDIVLVPSDGVCLSGSEESDDSDWSIGWMEPHAPEFFQTDDDEDDNDEDADNSFAVLVPCYRNDFMAFKGKKVQQANDFTSEGNKYMEQWLSSLQNF